MSQEQPRRPPAGGGQDQEGVKYGDVFDVSGELASKTVAPRDAAMMQSAETTVLGQTQKGGPAATMQSAAMQNERAGVVGHVDVSHAAGDRGVTVTETDVPGYRIVTESVAGQVVGQYVEPTATPQATVVSAVTIGKALEATARTVGDKPVEQSAAQSAASYNATIERDENKIKLKDVLTGATTKLPVDKAVTRQDAEGVTSAEL